MITRIVKMTFKLNSIDSFRNIFRSNNEKIRNFEGCHSVTLVQDVHDKRIFFTISLWESEDHLNRYRNSTFFKNTWQNTRKLFEDSAVAWSTEEQVG